MDGICCRQGFPDGPIPHTVGAGCIDHHLYCFWLLGCLSGYHPAHPDVIVRPGYIAGYAIAATIGCLVVDIQILLGQIHGVIISGQLEAHKLGVLLAPDGYLVIKVCNTLVGDRDILRLRVHGVGWIVVILGPCLIPGCISLSCKDLVYCCHACPLPLSCLIVIRLVVIRCPFSRWPTTPILN